MQATDVVVGAEQSRTRRAYAYFVGVDGRADADARVLELLRAGLLGIVDDVHRQPEVREKVVAAGAAQQVAGAEQLAGQ